MREKIKIAADHFVSGYLGLLVSVIVIFLVLPLFDRSFIAHVALQTCFIVLIVSTLYIISNKSSHVVIGSVLTVFFTAFDLISLFRDSLFFMLLAYSVYCLFLIYAIVILTDRLFGATQADINLIFGAITLYMLAGVFWAKLYFLVDALVPNSMDGLQNLYASDFKLDEAYENHFNTLYFSFTTLTGLGLGDIFPKHHLAKSLVVLEAVFGQLFVATVVAKTVSVWRNV